MNKESTRIFTDLVEGIRLEKIDGTKIDLRGKSWDATREEKEIFVEKVLCILDQDGSIKDHFSGDELFIAAAINNFYYEE